MASELDKQIQHRAYEIWESEGRPEGRQQEHWQQARAEFQDAKSEADASKGRARKTKTKTQDQAKVGSTGQAKPKAAAKPTAAKPTRGGKS